MQAFFLSDKFVIYTLIGLVLILAILVVRLEFRLSKLLRGKDAKSLEDTIEKLTEQIRDLNHFRDESIDFLKLIEYRLKRSVQAVETMRFNPFKGEGIGGNQSFSTAIVNEKGDGTIISTLYARESTNVYSKPVKKFVPEFELTKEEKEVLDRAKSSLSIPVQR